MITIQQELRNHADENLLTGEPNVFHQAADRIDKLEAALTSIMQQYRGGGPFGHPYEIARTALGTAPGCWRCNNGANPCPFGHPNQCEYPAIPRTP